jgi:hypothetical protein
MQACTRRWASPKWDSDVLPIRKITTFPADPTRFLLMRPVPQWGTTWRKRGASCSKKRFSPEHNFFYSLPFHGFIGYFPRYVGMGKIAGCETTGNPAKAKKGAGDRLRPVITR